MNSEQQQAACGATEAHHVPAPNTAAVSPEARSAFTSASLLESACHELPTDLRAWVPTETLVAWVRHDVELLSHVYHIGLQPEGELYPEGLPRALVSLLAFAYLTGTYDPEDICEDCHTHSALGTLAGGLAFFPEDLPQFRHAHRHLLVVLLTRLLASAVAERCHLARGLLPRAIFQKLEAEAVARINIAHSMEFDVE
jgi:hypothetical protein